MSQAYQAPQVSSIDVAEPILAIQQPRPQLLARRAVDQVKSVQPQRLKVPPQQVKRAARSAATDRRSSSPAQRPQSKVQSAAPRRIQIDWEARLREARQRIAQAKKAAPVKNVSPTMRATGDSKKVALARVGSAVDLIPPSKFSRSVRQSAPTQPVIRANDIGVPATRGRAVADDRALRPRSGGQLYAQRLNALRNGQIYTQLPVNSFYEQWQETSAHPNYAQWRELLALEARVAGRGKGASSVTAMVGDSLSQWFPADQLPGRQLWLNQGISGDTTTGILDRLNFLDTAKPDTIYFMAGVNDLKRGDNERDILRNISQIISRLKRQHPNAQIIVQSILPTRSAQIPNDRIAKLNPLIQELARRQGVEYLDLQPQFRDGDGSLRADLTTDGIHLSPQGYQVWQLALQRMDQRLAQRPRTIAQAQATPSSGN